MFHFPFVPLSIQKFKNKEYLQILSLRILKQIY